MKDGLVVLRHKFDIFSCHLQININSGSPHLHNNRNVQLYFFGPVLFLVWSIITPGISQQYYYNVSVCTLQRTRFLQVSSDYLFHF